MNAADYLRRHRCHDVPHLLKRWRAVARAARLTVQEIHVSGGLPVLYIYQAVATEPRLYLSAGVHGDEPAPVSALLEWAEENTTLLRSLPVCLFPIFNPAGLAANTRADHRHIDLNRRFHDISHPHIKAWWRCVEPLPVRLALCLHEDYDARGLYCYELPAPGAPLLANAMLRAGEAAIPRDPRSKIEGRKAVNGVIMRRRIPNLPGLPEAIALWMHGAHTLTFETPSEFSLAERVVAQQAFIAAAAARVRAGESFPGAGMGTARAALARV